MMHTSLSFLKTTIRTLDRQEAFGGDEHTKWLAREFKRPEYHARVNAVVKLFPEMKVLPRSSTVMYQYANIVPEVLHFN